MVSTVKVPEPLTPLFEAAERHVSRYFEQREFHPDKGTIDIFGARYILLRGPSISVEFFQLCRKLFGPDEEEVANLFAASLLYELAHSIGQADAKSFHQKMNLKDPIAKLSAGPVHFAHTGWAFVDILEESTLSADSDYFVIYKHPYSFESDAWQGSKLEPDSPVCVMNAGYSSGWCEESFGIPLESRELTCRALGHRDCLFVMAQPDLLDSRASTYIKTHPDLECSHDSGHSHRRYFDAQSAVENADEKGFGNLLSQHLFTYARNLEDTRTDLATKVQQLNEEIDARSLAEARLSKSETRWRELSDVLFDSILVVRDQKVVYANTASESLFGMPRDSLLDIDPADLLGQSNWLTLSYSDMDSDHDAVELEIVAASGILFAEVQCFQGDDEELIVALRDASDRIRARHQLEHLANYDSLTELPNRNMIDRIVSRQIDNSRDDDLHAMLFLDLDHFKDANDAHGHRVGDLVLQEVTNRAIKAVRAGDVLSRVGGDEFLLWMPYMSDPIDIQTSAQRLLECLRTPLRVQGYDLNVTFSIGVAIYPHNGRDFETLYVNADRAMYQAKAAGRNAYRFYTGSPHTLSERDDSPE